MNFIEALMMNPLLQSALLAGIAASVVSGVVGSYVVIKRISFISGSIAHAVLGGIGCAIWLERKVGWSGLSPLHGALLAALIAALAIGLVRRWYRQREDSVLAAIWSLGMALGVIFIAQTPGYNVELTNYLIGNLLWVSGSDLWNLYLLDAVALLLVGLFYKPLLLLCFDEEEARLQGVPVNRLYLLLLTLIAISVVLLIQVVGIILVITLLTLPATIANLYARRLPQVMLLSVALCALFNVTGTVASYYLNWPLGATIALLTGTVYLGAILLRRTQNL